LADALRESEERYRTLVNTAPDAVVVKNHRRIEFVNAAALELLGAAEPEEVVGRSPFAFVHPEERTKVESQLCALLERAERPPISEHRVVRVDGTAVTVEATASAFGIGGSRLAQVILRDVTRRKADEQALRESEERFRLIAETISEVFWMADVNIERMVYVSPAYERVWGRTCRSLYENPRSFLDAVHPDDLGRVLETLDAEKNIGKAFDHEYRIVRPSGETRWIWERGFPVIGDDGRIRHFVGVAEDITRRRLREQELRESLERFELVARATHDAVWDFNVKTGEAWWADAWYEKYGLPRDERPSFERWASHIHPDDHDRVTRSFAQLLQSDDQEWTEEYRYRRANGSYANVVDRAYVVRDPTGKVLRVSGVLEDVTERLTLQAQLQQAARMEAIGRLAGGVAHDFNNLLTVINGHASFIAETEGSTPDTTESATQIIDAAERATSLTRQLLLFSRRQALQRTHFDVTDALASMWKMLSRIVGEDVHVEFHLPQHPSFIDADAGMVDQIVLNLVVNARDAMPKGGLLVVSAREVTLSEVPAHTEAVPGRYVCIAVSDTGDGIPPAVLPHIFEPFFSTKEAGRGTGLGLATVFGVVKQHQGWVDVNTAAGQGTTFYVWLPLSESQEPPPVIEKAITAAHGGETVLLVEDETSVLMLMRRTLERQGYRVLPASAASEAFDVWRSNRESVHLLVTDMVLPLGVSGRELAAQLRADRPSLRVLIVSGYSADFSGKEFKHQAGQYFLQKPFTPTRFVETVRACLDSAEESPSG
jgi:PAS domain S-box-containing protein